MADAESGIPVGSRWQTGPWRETPRYLTVNGGHVVAAAKESILIDNDIDFTFDDGQVSSCSLGAFRKSFVRAPS